MPSLRKFMARVGKTFLKFSADAARLASSLHVAVCFSLQPEDNMYGSDLGSVDCRAEVTGTIKRERPRLVIVEFPCKL